MPGPWGVPQGNPRPRDPSEQEAWRKEIGQRIRNARKALGLTQEALSELAGLHPGYLSQIERGMRTPSTRVLARLAEVCGCPPSYLLGPLGAERERDETASRAGDGPVAGAGTSAAGGTELVDQVREGGPPPPPPGPAWPADDPRHLVEELQRLLAGRPAAQIRLVLQIARTIFQHLDQWRR